MALLSIVSQNPDLGYVLCKNPNTIKETGPYKNKIRKGIVRGWFQDSKEDGVYRFHLFFRDHPSETSFSGEFEYLDQSRYLSPVALTNMMTLCLGDALKGKTENYDTPHACVVTAALDLGSFMSNMVTKNMSDKVALSRIINNVYKVSVTSDSVSEALNILYSICVGVELSGKPEESGIELNRASMQKVIRVLLNAKAPYRLFRSILTKGVNNRSLFEELKAVLPSSWDLKFGNNQVQRLDAIKTCLISDTQGRTLVDIGCGEMFNSRKLMSKFHSVVAIDKDKELMEDAPYRLKSTEDKEKTTLLNEEVTPEFLQGLGSVLSDSVVLMTEFLEHIDPVSAVNILSEVLKHDPAQVIITLPNHNFNAYYQMEQHEMRHPDHIWEPDASAVDLLLEAAGVDPEVFDVHNLNLADVINSDPCFFTISLVRKQPIEKEVPHVEPVDAAV